MNSISLTIPVNPMSLQSSGKRMVIRNGKPVFFKTKKASDYQKIIRLYTTQFKPKQPWDCPIHLKVDYYLERPQRLNSKKHSPECIYHDKRPDLDNLQKGTQDAFKDFWIDDSQICSLSLRKYYCGKGEEPRIVFNMIQLTQ